MKKLVVVAALLMMLTGCSSTDNTFERENGVCYRTQTHKVFGIRASKEKVLAVDENCGTQK